MADPREKQKWKHGERTQAGFAEYQGNHRYGNNLLTTLQLSLGLTQVP